MFSTGSSSSQVLSRYARTDQSNWRRNRSRSFDSPCPVVIPASSSLIYDADIIGRKGRDRRSRQRYGINATREACPVDGGWAQSREREQDNRHSWSAVIVDGTPRPEYWE